MKRENTKLIGILAGMGPKSTPPFLDQVVAQCQIQYGARNNPPALLQQGLAKEPLAFFKVEDDPNYFAIFQTEEEIRDLQPKLSLLEQLHPFGVAATAPGDAADCVSRYFAPSYGIPEDPVTGSIHCALVPYWAAKLNKKHIRAHKLSSRGGELLCEHLQDRVSIAGEAVKYLEGTIYL